MVPAVLKWLAGLASANMTEDSNRLAEPGTAGEPRAPLASPGQRGQARQTGELPVRRQPVRRTT
jgi:hypothetical protein